MLWSTQRPARLLHHYKLKTTRVGSDKLMQTRLMNYSCGIHTLTAEDLPLAFHMGSTIPNGLVNLALPHIPELDLSDKGSYAQRVRDGTNIDLV